MNQLVAGVGRVVRLDHYGTFGLVWVVDLPPSPPDAHLFSSSTCLVVA